MSACLQKESLQEKILDIEVAAQFCLVVLEHYLANGCMYGWIGRWRDGWMDKRKDGQAYG